NHCAYGSIMNITANDARRERSVCLLLCRGSRVLLKDDFCLRKIAPRLMKRLLALHDGHSCHFAQLLYAVSRNFHNNCQNIITRGKRKLFFSATGWLCPEGARKINFASLRRLPFLKRL